MAVSFRIVFLPLLIFLTQTLHATECLRYYRGPEMLNVGNDYGRWDKLSDRLNYNTYRTYGDVLDKLKRIFSKSLDELRDASLKETLKAHGYKSAKSGREALKELSAHNLDRIRTQLKSSLDKAPAEYRELADTIRFAFSHNSHHYDKSLRLPLLSHRRLMQSGVGIRGHTSVSAINSYRSDDQAFFSVVTFTNKREAPRTAKNIYGNRGYFVRPRYAIENGWISQYVMYNSDLHNFVRANEFPSSQKLSPQKRFKDSEKLNTQYAKELHRLDFTIPDFEEVVRLQLVASLVEAKEKAPHIPKNDWDWPFYQNLPFEKAIKYLQEGSPSGVMTEYVLKRLGFTSGEEGQYIEFKIPVAIPDDQITSFFSEAVAP